MTDQSGWGGWSPQQRPEEPTPPPGRDAEQPTPDGRDAASEPPRPYGAPSYGTPSYGAPTYGAPGEQGGPPPTRQESYGQESYGQPTAAYGAPTEQPSYGQSSTPYGGGYPPPANPTPQGQGVQSPGSPDQPTQVFGAYGGYQGGPNPAGPPAGPPGANPYGANPYGTPPPPAKKRSGGKIALVIGVVVVLVAGLGVGAWALFLRGGPAVTWQGKEVTNAGSVLSEAQVKLALLVDTVKGVKAEDTRCYFAVAKNPPKDTPKTDVGDTLYCGPALFVDGDTDKPFIPYGISANSTDSDKVTLSITAEGTQDGATSAPADDDLVRPDGATPPSGTGGLSVPEPPPADENVFAAADGLEVPDAPAGAVMAALDGGVTIEKLGEVKRYGEGVDARSAPDGQKLIGFQLGDAAGDGASDGPDVLDLQVSVDGGAGQDIPDLTGVNVIAVPTDAKSVDLVTSANKVKQTLSLLTGKPGSGNIQVLARANRFGSFKPPAGFTFTETGGGSTAARPCTLTGSVAGLFFWADDKGSAQATAANNAILETDLKYTFSTDSPPPFTGSSAGDTATFEPSHLTLTLPDGAKVPAKIVADRTVFEVPANFTEGTITVGGAFTNANAITFTVATAVSFKVAIPTS